jgi:sulfite exporter TauE/SafE/copper chaperone CopZ
MATEQTNQQRKTLNLDIAGMYCTNCEVLIERRLRNIPGIVGVRASQRKGKAEIDYVGELDIEAARHAIEEEGYSVSSWGEQNSSARGRLGNTSRDYLEIGAIFLLLFGLYIALSQFDVLPRGVTISDNMSYALVFLVGLVASVTSCIAVTGGLLLAVAAKYNTANPGLAGLQKLKPHIYFNFGRIVSYTLLGGAVGALGSALTLSPEVNAALTLLASIVMIVLGLQMLGLFPSLGRLQPRMPKSLAHKIHDLSGRESKAGAFVLGASTFFLPCGFTQAMQLYVLAKASFVTGALTMLAFSLGTLPALLSLSALSSFASGNFQRHFLKFAGAAVIILGFVNIQYGLVLAKTSVNTAAVVEGEKFKLQPAPVPDQSTMATPPAPLSQSAEQTSPVVQKQIVVMKVVGFDYVPNRFIVAEGVPVEWRIDASEAAGCGRILIMPRLRLQKFLSATSTTFINFTPPQAGELAFNCGMGMMTPNSKFIVLSKTSG